MITNKQKALIHIAKAQLGMTDAEYRDLLGGFGVDSSTRLTQAKFSQVLRRFETLGFKSKRKAGGDKPRPYKTAAVPRSKEKLLWKIAAIRAELELTRGYVDGIARNMFCVDVYSWCDADQLHCIVAALVYHQKRAKRKANGQ